jgi:hypothetical protein
MTTKDSSTKAQAIAVPKEPPEMIARRAKILGELDKQSKGASGNVKACMLKSIQVLKSMEPSAPLDEKLYQDFTEAFMRLAKDPAALPPPEIFLSCIEYMQERIAVLSPAFTSVAAENEMKAPAIKAPDAAAAPAAPTASTATAAPAKASKDGFESTGSAKKKMSLGEEAAPPPAPTATAATPEGKKQEELESFKTWMKNPALGKMKG